MFLPIVVEQVRRLIRHRHGRTDIVQRDALLGLPANVSSVPGIPEVATGTRYQLFRALRAMDEGQVMLVERKIPALPGHFDDVTRRLRLFRTLRDVSGWQTQTDIEPVLVPGTAYPSVIGRILIRSGWCAPSIHPHWVPNLRFYYLTDLGHETYIRAQAWWSGLTLMEQARLVLLE